jgi:predicted SAM-dependent methyltransferase
LRQAARRGIWALRADLNRSIPLSESSVDAILASDVLEHLVEPSVFVKELYRVLRPGGYVVLDTPNLASWHNVFALLVGVQPFSGPNITTMEDSDVSIVRQMHRSTHGLAAESEYTDRGEHELTRHIVVVAYVSLVRLFQRTGFEIEMARGFGYYPFPGWFARVFARLDPRHAHHVLIKARKSPV